MVRQNRRAVLPTPSTRSAEATASGSVVSGFLHRGHVEAARLQSRDHLDQQEPSANSPCTSTTLRAFGGVAFHAMPRVETKRGRRAGKQSGIEKVRSVHHHDVSSLIMGGIVLMAADAAARLSRRSLAQRVDVG